MLTVYTRHAAKCPKRDEPTWRRCRCAKWIDGTCRGRFRVSAKTTSWEKAGLLARRYKHADISGDNPKSALYILLYERGLMSNHAYLQP